MSLKFFSEADENYYVPFLDLMSGVVFILMIVLSGELMNIKYPENTISIAPAQPIQTIQVEPVERFKRNLISSISLYLKKYKIENQISEDYNFLRIHARNLFAGESFALSKNGNFIQDFIKIFIVIKKMVNFGLIDYGFKDYVLNIFLFSSIILLRIF